MFRHALGNARHLGWEVVSKANQAKNKYFLDFDKIWGDTNRNLSLPKSVNIQRGNNE